MGLGVFQVGESFHQLSSVLGEDGGVRPQKQSLTSETTLRSDSKTPGSCFSCFLVILSSGFSM